MEVIYSLNISKPSITKPFSQKCKQELNMPKQNNLDFIRTPTDLYIFIEPLLYCHDNILLANKRFPCTESFRIHVVFIPYDGMLPYNCLSFPEGRFY